jgi:ABC-type Na+ efflux pump permease subunit
MGIGISIVMIAVGAVMTFALDVQNHSGVNLDTIGVILMVVGALGLLASLTIFGSMGGRGGDVVVEERRVR